MTCAYIVRCNFTAPAKEEAWNAWYSGPKMSQMLGQPHFLACQRFRKASGSGRDYLALWTLASPEALKTSEYTAQWGFAEWAPHITGWSRDLFDASRVSAKALAVPTDGCLAVAAFDGLNAKATLAAAETIAGSLPDMMWLPAIGLDRHTSRIGLLPCRSPGPDAPGGGNSQIAVYRPITASSGAPA